MPSLKLFTEDELDCLIAAPPLREAANAPAGAVPNQDPLIVAPPLPVAANPPAGAVPPLIAAPPLLAAADAHAPL